MCSPYLPAFFRGAIVRRVLPALFCAVLAVAAGADDTPVFEISTSYQNLLSNSNGTGMLDRIMREAFSRVGMDARIVFTRTDKSLADVNAGLLDGELNRIAGMEQAYPNLVRVPEPNMTMHFVAFAKEDYDTSSWESIRNRYIGIVRGWKILERNTDGFPHVLLVPTETELFRMLHKDRLDMALYAKLTGYAAVKSMGYGEIHHLDPPLASREMYLYVHESHEDLVDDIAEALGSMKADGTYDQIVHETTAPYLTP
jgi:polar amino acid transport system substrate-binding protein